MCLFVCFRGGGVGALFVSWLHSTAYMHSFGAFSMPEKMAKGFIRRPVGQIMVYLMSYLQIDHLDPEPPLGEVVQDMCST